MRKIAKVKELNRAKQIMIYSDDNSVYVFLYDSDDRCASAYSDYWFEDISDAEDFCEDEFNINKKDWKIIKDPLPDCQHDIIEPVRVKGRNIGKPEWGKFEKFKDGKWVEINLKKD